jgi:hypothetical protein
VCAEKIKQARNYQLEATQVLAELLKSKDLVKTAQENVDSLSESFFMIASTYLDLVGSMTLLPFSGMVCLLRLFSLPFQIHA